MSRRRRWPGAGLLVVLSAGLVGSALPGCLALVDFKQKCDSYNACESGKRCDPDSETCEPLIPCSSNAQCGAYACNTSSGTCFFDCNIADGDSLSGNPHCSASASCSSDSWCH